jgi:hypothetical protein
MQLAIGPRLRHRYRPEIAEDPLVSRLAPHIEDTARRYLDPDRIRALAEDMRIVQRQRVHDAGLVAAAFIVSAFEGGSDTEGRILDRRTNRSAERHPARHRSGAWRTRWLR